SLLRSSASPLFPSTTLFRSFVRLAVNQANRNAAVPLGHRGVAQVAAGDKSARGGIKLMRKHQAHATKPAPRQFAQHTIGVVIMIDRKSTRLNSSHVKISYAV